MTVGDDGWLHPKDAAIIMRKGACRQRSTVAIEAVQRVSGSGVHRGGVSELEGVFAPCDTALRELVLIHGLRS